MLCVLFGSKYCVPVKSAQKVSREAKDTHQFFDTSVLVEKYDGSIVCHAEDEVIDIDLTGIKPTVCNIYNVNEAYTKNHSLKRYFE